MRPVDGAEATCGRCGAPIEYVVDLQDDGAGGEVDHGVWVTHDSLHSCIPGPEDEDRYHDPDAPPVTDEDRHHDPECPRHPGAPDPLGTKCTCTGGPA